MAAFVRYKKKLYSTREPLKNSTFHLSLLYEIQFSLPYFKTAVVRDFINSE
jgi:hypothetical protein